MLINYGDLVTAIQTEVTSALGAVIPLVGIMLGAIVGYKFIRRFV